jgi:hypothetical protein
MKTKNQVIKDVQDDLAKQSPQIQVDVDNGPFYYLAARAVAQPIADLGSEVDRLAQVSTFNFPAVTTAAEQQVALRSFGFSQPRGGFSGGTALFITSRRPVGTESFYVRAGDIVSTGDGVGSLSFAAIETRALTANNADKFYNAATRRYELPVRVRALAAGTASRIAPVSLRSIRSGAANFEAVTNTARFRGGASIATTASAYATLQTRLTGMDNFSKGGLVTRARQYDVDNVLDVAKTTSSEYPLRFYRVPDGPAIDIWVLCNPVEENATESIIAASAQSTFVLPKGPALGLSSVTVNGVAVAASLEQDGSLALGRSTRESSTVTLETPVAAGDFVDISYTYDAIPSGIQADIATQREAGDLFGVDVLVRYALPLHLQCTVRGTVLPTYVANTVGAEVDAAIANYMLNGTQDSPLLGGTRTVEEMMGIIRSIPGVDRVFVDRFGRKEFPGRVEPVQVPAHSYAAFEFTSDRSTRFV